MARILVLVVWLVQDKWVVLEHPSDPDLGLEPIADLVTPSVLPRLSPLSAWSVGTRSVTTWKVSLSVHPISGPRTRTLNPGCVVMVTGVEVEWEVVLVVSFLVCFFQVYFPDSLNRRTLLCLCTMYLDVSQTTTSIILY